MAHELEKPANPGRGLASRIKMADLTKHSLGTVPERTAAIIRLKTCSNGMAVAALLSRVISLLKTGMPEPAHSTSLPVGDAALLAGWRVELSVPLLCALLLDSIRIRAPMQLLPQDAPV